MNPRLNVLGSPTTAKILKHLTAAGQAVSAAGLSSTTQELVKIRASQINGCGFCTDMHTKEAEAAGETSLRLNLIAVWREATVFTDAERAALELTEQGTRIADAAAWGPGRGLGAGRRALRRGPAHRPGLPDLPHQRLQPAERHRPAARGRLQGGPVRLTGV